MRLVETALQAGDVEGMVDVGIVVRRQVKWADNRWHLLKRAIYYGFLQPALIIMEIPLRVDVVKIVVGKGITACEEVRWMYGRCCLVRGADRDERLGWTLRIIEIPLWKIG